MDFAPGIVVTDQDIRGAIARAGFKPGPITLISRPEPTAEDHQAQPDTSPAAQILRSLSGRKTSD